MQWEHLQDSLHGYKNQSLLLREPLQPTMPLNKADDTPPLVALRFVQISSSLTLCSVVLHCIFPPLCVVGLRRAVLCCAVLCTVVLGCAVLC